MLVFALVACTEPVDTGEPTAPDEIDLVDPTVPPTGDDDDDLAVGDPTFHRDVAPLLAESCARCHSGSGFGPGDFLDHATASAWAEVMVDRIDAGEMPPPAADPACHPYRDQDLYQVAPALRDTLARWIELGMPEGDAVATAPVVRVPATLVDPDLEMRSLAPRVPEFADGNEYRCFLLGTVASDTWVTGVEFLNDNPEITHHGVLFIDPDGGSEAEVTDAATASWHCSVSDLPGAIVHAWAPSGGALVLPPDTGIHFPAGSQLILQVHYYEGTAAALADQPGYAFTTAPSVERELINLGAGPSSFLIPAGDPNYTAGLEVPVSYLSGSSSLEVWGAFPHMHILGTGYDFRTTSGTCISSADEYDFSMQPTYWFDEPVVLEPNDTLSVSCTWDNSSSNPLQVNDPPVAVTFGENTQNEMCYAFLYATIR